MLCGLLVVAECHLEGWPVSCLHRSLVWAGLAWSVDLMRMSLLSVGRLKLTTCVYQKETTSQVLRVVKLQLGRWDIKKIKSYGGCLCRPCRSS